MNHLLPAAFFEWCVNTSLAKLISQSMWGFAVLETIHLTGLAVFLGWIFVLNLTVLGVGMKKPAGSVARELGVWGLTGLGVMVASGLPMFMSAAVTYSGSIPFLVKMSLLILSIALQTTIHKVPGMYEGSVAGKVLAGIALICWFAVAYAGRAIAFEVLFDPAA